MQPSPVPDSHFFHPTIIPPPPLMEYPIELMDALAKDKEENLKKFHHDLPRLQSHELAFLANKNLTGLMASQSLTVPSSDLLSFHTLIWDKKNYLLLENVWQRDPGLMASTLGSLNEHEIKELLLQSGLAFTDEIAKIIADMKPPQANDLLIEIIDQGRSDHFESVFQKMTPRKRFHFLVEYLHFEARKPGGAASQLALVQGSLAKMEEFKDIQLAQFLADFKADPLTGALKHLGKTPHSCFNNASREYLQSLNGAKEKCVPNLKLIAHIFADFCIKNTYLEGISKVTAVEYLLNILEWENNRIGANLTTNALNVTVQHLTKYRHWIEKLEVVRQTDKSFKAIRPLAGEMIADLKKSGHLLFPLGWDGLPGHAMLGEIKKEPEGNTYTLCIYNTGDGLSHNHHSRSIGNKIKYCPTYVLKGISAEKLQPESLLTILLAMQIHIPAKTEDHFKADDIYNLIKNTLGGTVSDHLKLPNEAFISEQQAGTCSWKSLMIYLRQNMPYHDYIKLKFKLRLMSYALFFEQAEKQPIHPDSVWFYKEIKKKFGLHILKLYRKALISHEDFLLAAALVLREGNLSIAPVPAPSQPSSTKVNLLPDVFGIRFPIPHPHKSLNISRKLLDARLPPLDEPPGIPNDLSVVSNPAALKEFLKTSMEFAQKLKAEGKNKQLTLFLNKVLLKLPNLGSKTALMKGGVWGTFSGADAIDCSTYIFELSKLYLTVPASRLPEGIVNRQYLNAVMFILVRARLKDELNGKDILEDILPWHYGLNEWISSIKGPFSHPKINERLNQIFLFFKKSSHIKDRNNTEEYHLFGVPNNSECRLIKNDSKCKLVDRYLEVKGEKDRIPQHSDYLNFYVDIFNKQTLLPDAFWKLWNLYLANFCGNELNDAITLCPYASQNKKNEISAYLKSCGRPIKNATISWKTESEMHRPSPEEVLESFGSYMRIPKMLDFYEKKLQALASPAARSYFFDILFGIQKGIGPSKSLASLFEMEMNHENAELIIKKLRFILKELLISALTNNTAEEFLFVCKTDFYIKEALACLRNSRAAYPEYESIVSQEDLMAFYEKSQGLAKLQCGYEYLRRTGAEEPINLKWLEIALSSVLAGFIQFAGQHECYINIWDLFRSRAQECQTLFSQLTQTEQALFLRNVLSREGIHIDEQVIAEGSWPQIKLGPYQFNLSTGFIQHGERILCRNEEELSKVEGLKAAQSGDETKQIMCMDRSRMISPDGSIAIEFLDANSWPVVTISKERLMNKALQLGAVKAFLSLSANEYLYLHPDSQKKASYPAQLNTFELGFGTSNELPQMLKHSRFERWSAKDPRANQMYLLDERDKRVIGMEVNNNNKQLVGIRDLSNGFVLVASRQPLYDDGVRYALSILNNIEEMSALLIWQKTQANSSDVMIELMRYGLHFESVLSKQTGRIAFFCKEHPGYFLCSPPDCFPLKNLQSVIFLQNGSGQFRALIPKRKFYRCSSADFPLHSAIAMEPLKDIEEKAETIVLNYDSHARSELKMPHWNGTKADMAHFLNLMIHAKNYHLALAYLRRIYTTEPDKEFIDCLKEIVLKYHEKSDDHPNHYALLAHIGWLMLEMTKNERKIRDNLYNFWEVYREIFKIYLQKAPNMDRALQLTFEQVELLHQTQFKQYSGNLMQIEHFRRMHMMHNGAQASISEFVSDTMSAPLARKEFRAYGELKKVIAELPYKAIDSSDDLAGFFSPGLNLDAFFLGFFQKILVAHLCQNVDALQQVVCQAHFCPDEYRLRSSNKMYDFLCLLANRQPGEEVWQKLVEVNKELRSDADEATLKPLLESIFEVIHQEWSKDVKPKQKVKHPSSKKKSADEMDTPELPELKRRTVEENPAHVAQSIQQNNRFPPAKPNRTQVLKLMPGRTRSAAELESRRKQPLVKLSPKRRVDDIQVLDSPSAKLVRQAVVPILSHTESYCPFQHLFEQHFIQNNDLVMGDPSLLDMTSKPKLAELYKDKVSALLLKRLQNDSASVKPSLKFQIKDRNALPVLKTQLDAYVSSGRQELEKYFQEMVWNLQPAVNKKGALERSVVDDYMTKILNIVTAQSPEIDIRMLLDWFLMAELDLEDGVQLKMRHSLLETIKLCLHLQIAFAAAKQCDMLIQSKGPLEAAKQEQELGKILSGKLPTVSAEAGPLARAQYFYQVVSHKILRERQLEVLKNCDSIPKIALQMGCGEGKTKVISVVLAISQMLHNRTVVNVVPQANLETNYEDLREFFTEHTGFKPKRFLFSRDTPIDQYRLEIFTKELLDSKKNGTIIVTDPQSIQSLQLRYFEQLLLAGNFLNEELNKKYECFESMLEHLMHKSTAVMDEVHLTLKTLHYLNYALKDEALMPSYRWELPALVYQIMLEANAKADIPCRFPIGEQIKTAWTVDEYHQHQKPYLAKILAAQHAGDQDKQLFVDYMCCNRAALTVEQRAELQKWLKTKPRETQYQLKLLRAHLNSYLPHNLNARCDVHYGPSKEVEYAIPYVHNMAPSEKSTFENYDILVNFTYQMYLIKGLSLRQVKLLLQSWQKQDKLERAAGIASTQAKFDGIYKDAPRLFTLKLEDEATLTKLHQAFAKDKTAVFEYLQNFLFPEMKVQKSKLSSSAQDLAGILFSRIIAFSGTLLSNYLTMPLDMQTKFEEGTDSEMLSTFLAGGHAEIKLADTLDFKTLLADPKVCMVLDPHAYLEGCTNESVAKALLEAAPPRIKLINYFDTEKNLLTSLKRDGIEGQNTTDLAGQVTYCDQQHTTGTDTMQPADGIGVLLANKGLTLTELFQAAKRLRGLGKGQKVHIVITKDLGKVICKKMQISQIDMEHFVLWCLLNESQQLKNSLFASFQQQVQAVYKRRLMHKLIAVKNQNASFEKKIDQRVKLADEYKALIVDEVNNEEFLDHGSIDEPNPPFLALRQLVQKYAESYPGLLNNQDKDELDQIMRKANDFLCVTYEENVDDLLDKSSQREMQSDRDVQDLLERERYFFHESGWSPEYVFENESFKTKFIENKAREPYEQYQKMEKSPRETSLCFFENYARVLPELDLDARIYATNNYFKKSKEYAFQTKSVLSRTADAKEIELFRKHLPPIEHLLAVYSGKKAKKYIVLSSKEANDVREILLKPNAKFKFLVDVILYNLSEESWGSTSKDIHDPDLPNILAQLKFVNGETIYLDQSRKAVTDWLQEDKTAAKIKFFCDMNKLCSSRRYAVRSLKGTIIQEIFEECAQTA